MTRGTRDAPNKVPFAVPFPRAWSAWQSVLAKREGRTKTEVLREALRRYGEEKRWRRLKRYGAGRARKVGMTEADVERAVREFRRGR